MFNSYMFDDIILNKISDYLRTQKVFLLKQISRQHDEFISNNLVLKSWVSQKINYRLFQIHKNTITKLEAEVIFNMDLSNIKVIKCNIFHNNYDYLPKLEHLECNADNVHEINNNFPNLERLILRSNDLLGIADIKNLKKLKTLELAKSCRNWNSLTRNF